VTDLASPQVGSPLGSSDAAFDGFVHADAGRLLDGRNEPILLRGVGLGNWLLPEGYMWKFKADSLQSPRQIEAFISDLVGPARAAIFWSEFENRFVAKPDIAQIAAEGMNHVRLPINSRLIMNDDGVLAPAGLAPIDRLIGWCRTHGLWVVLDLHGAPGGQTGTNIDDSPNGAPELFANPRYREQTIALWQALAHRYRDETVVAGYDLLNEPLPNEYQHTYADELVALYRDLSAAIRDVDPDHLIIYEGTHWATNWSIFTEVWDANSMLSFHKYWSPPDRPSIQTYLDLGRELDLPIYMGEGGENTVDWLQTAFQLYEDHGISWNFWPWKKIDTHSSPCSVNAPAQWPEILAYGDGRRPRPQPDEAWEALSELLDALELENCTYRPEIISALLHRAPLRIPATGFGFRGPGESYQTTSAVPLAGFRSDDLVTITDSERTATGQLSFEHVEGMTRDATGELVVSLVADDWIAYDVNVAQPTNLAVSLAMARSSPEQAPDAMPIAVSIDGEPVRVELNGGSIRGTSGSPVDAGGHVLRVDCLARQAAIRSIDVTCIDGGRVLDG
jgi:endoglucanase